MTRICIIPQVHGTGGMVSFRDKFSAGLQARDIEVCYDLDDSPYDAILLINSTRQLGKLWRAKQRGVPIIQRLDGINWVHRLRPTGLRHYLRSEFYNWLMAFIRRRIATGIVYQSHFVVQRWEKLYGPTRIPYNIVHNGVDLDIYTPDGPHQRADSPYRLLVVEGSLGGGHEDGLRNAVQLAEKISQYNDLPIELMVAGLVPQASQNYWTQQTIIPITWAGVVPAENIPEIDRSAHALFSAEVNAACPNSVIEAMACGLPILAFGTGSLSELVTGDAGRITPYGADPLKMETPTIVPLAKAAVEVLQDQNRFRSAARERAETEFGLDKMVDGYLQALVN